MKPYLHTLCVVLTIVGIALTQSAKAQTIAITETNPTEMLCAGQSVSVSFNTTGTFLTGNVFNVQLSNAAGSFTIPTIIGTALWSGTGNNNQTVNCLVPPLTATGSGYRIRIVSTLPGITSSTTFKQFIISKQCGCNTELLTKEWELSFGGSGSDALVKVIPTADGGYLLAGTSSSGISGTKTVASNGQGDYYVIKLDASNNISWQKTFGGTGNEELKAVVQDAGGGYILVGNSASGADGNKTSPSNGLYDFWIVRISATGTKLWDRAFGGTQSDFAYDIKTSEDGAYWIAGTSLSPTDVNKASPSYGGYDFWLIKVNTSGTKIADYGFGGTNEDAALRLITKSNGNLLLGGYSRSGISGNKSSASFGGADYWMIEVNTTGVIQSQCTFGGDQDDIFQDMIATKDGNILMSGTSESNISGNKTTSSNGSKDMWIVKANGTTSLWQKNYGTTNIDLGMSLKEASNDSYLIAGSGIGTGGDKTTPAFGSSDLWAINLDQNGNEITQLGFGGTLADQANSITYTNDGGFLIAGFSQSPICSDKTSPSYGAEDFWIVKVKVASTKLNLDKISYCKSNIDTARIKLNCNALVGGDLVEVQLSDNTGSFASPTVLGNVIPSVSNFKLPFTIPGIVASGNYKIRLVVKSTPQVIGDTISVTVNASPDPTVAESCTGGKSFQATLLGGASIQWMLNGTDLSGETNASVTPLQFGTFSARLNFAGCTALSANYTVKPAHLNSTHSSTLSDGVHRFLCDATTGDVIAKLQDNVGGNVLNNTSAKLFIDASVQNYNGDPYLQRHWDITPTSTGPATVTIYVKQTEFDSYNAFVSASTPKMPTNPSDLTGISNIMIMQCHGTSSTFLPGSYTGATEFKLYPGFTTVWNATANVWEISFPVTNFSGIFLLTKSGSQLPVEFVSFTGEFNSKESVIKLDWATASEKNCKDFEVQRMKQDNSFETIGTVDGSGNSTTYKSYTFNDQNYVSGNNYYRLKQNDFNGNAQFSDIVIVKATKQDNVVQAENILKAWVNQQNLTIESNQDISFKVYDLKGDLITSSENVFNKSFIVDVAQWQSGLYIVQTNDINGNQSSKKIIK